MLPLSWWGPQELFFQVWSGALCRYNLEIYRLHVGILSASVREWSFMVSVNSMWKDPQSISLYRASLKKVQQQQGELELASFYLQYLCDKQRISCMQIWTPARKIPHDAWSYKYSQKKSQVRICWCKLLVHMLVTCATNAMNFFKSGIYLDIYLIKLVF